MNHSVGLLVIHRPRWSDPTLVDQTLAASGCKNERSENEDPKKGLIRSDASIHGQTKLRFDDAGRCCKRVAYASSLRSSTDGNQDAAPNSKLGHC